MYMQLLCWLWFWCSAMDFSAYIYICIYAGISTAKVKWIFIFHFHYHWHRTMTTYIFNCFHEQSFRTWATVTYNLIVSFPFSSHLSSSHLFLFQYFLLFIFIFADRYSITNYSLLLLLLLLNKEYRIRDTCKPKIDFIINVMNLTKISATFHSFYPTFSLPLCTILLPFS